jgi:hypothetical protein
MTFIASVIAKKGVAVIADSLVTSMENVIEYNRFLNFCIDKGKGIPIDEIKITPSELFLLFERKPSHTKDYEEKLFQYDKYTAVTTAGTAFINKKRIEYLVKEMIENNKKDKSYNRKRIETKINDFVFFLNKQTIEHLNESGFINDTTFIFTHYDKHKEQTEIYKVEINSCSKEDLIDDTSNYVSFRKMGDYYKVVCDRQNRISERILFGELDFFVEITPKIIENVIEKLQFPADKIPSDFIKEFMENARSFLPPQFFEDVKISRLADLSLQQAVDLASLLMKIEINFQKYTENIPTVGGVIKLAIIDKDGFKFISGNEILKSDNLN